MVVYSPGQEPEGLKKRLHTLFEKLDAAYPDKIIIGLAAEHKKWAETVSELYRVLGYADGKSFLEAYGYKYERKQAGRKKSTDVTGIIEELQRRYPNGSSYKTVGELFEANPDLLPKLKALMNTANATMGMPLKQYLVHMGLIKKRIYVADDKRKEIKKTTYISRPQKRENDLVEDNSSANDGIVLSEDGKHVIGIRKKKCRRVFIPPGVEVIDDSAFCGVSISELYINKDLKYVGLSTLNHYYGGPRKKLSHIEVEVGNEHYFSDGKGLYSILEDGRKRLERWLDTTITEYICPNDVISFARDAFAFCGDLRRVILSDGFEEFDEDSIHYSSPVKEVFISKSVKRIVFHFLRFSYRIDENNPYLFRDEDSIYEVLSDGSYRLLRCLYFGKGMYSVLDGTSIIGQSAFERNENLRRIEFPNSVSVIEKNAFAYTPLEQMTIPGTVQKIESYAFLQCNKLKKLYISQQVGIIEKDAFECYELDDVIIEETKKRIDLDEYMRSKTIL